MKNGLMVWHCKRTSCYGSEMETFSKPIPYRLQLNFLTIQPTNGKMDVFHYGDRVDKMWRGVAQPYGLWNEILQEGDRFYVDGKKPKETEIDEEPELGYGYDANAKIVSVRPQNMVVQFMLEKI